jgi:HSP20 family molecular chaperone IbpA
VKATYRDGILEIRVKTNGHREDKRRIPVNRI